MADVFFNSCGAVFSGKSPASSACIVNQCHNQWLLLNVVDLTLALNYRLHKITKLAKIILNIFEHN